MPILGIDYEKCINCGTCLLACGTPEAEDSEYGCNQCGQCIAQCPEDAILYDMGESFTFEHIENPKKIIPYETFFNFLVANRSVRRYKKEKVPKEILNKVILAMSRAPTGANMRSETFTVVSNPQKIKELSDAVVEAFKSGP
ncbi:MAG: nitroreductase family protein, partial [Promethearchaeota archaeon]